MPWSDALGKPLDFFLTGGKAHDTPFTQVSDQRAFLSRITENSPALVHIADSDEAARVYRTYSAHRSNLMPPTNPI